MVGKNPNFFCFSHHAQLLFGSPEFWNTLIAVPIKNFRSGYLSSCFAGVTCESGGCLLSGMLNRVDYGSAIKGCELDFRRARFRFRNKRCRYCINSDSFQRKREFISILCTLRSRLSRISPYQIQVRGKSLTKTSVEVKTMITYLLHTKKPQSQCRSSVRGYRVVCKAKR